MIRLGVAYEALDKDRLDPAFLTACYGIGVRDVQIFAYLDELWPVENRWNWTKLDDDRAKVIAAGMTYGVRIIGAPAHASEGKLAYGRFSCSRATPDGTGLEFREDLAHCTNPPHIDSQKMIEAGLTVATHCPDASNFSCGNESTGQHFWPPIRLDDGRDPVNLALRRKVEEHERPLIRGILTARPGATITGCEAAGADELRRMIELCGELYGYFTFHRYDRGGEDPYANMPTYMRILRDYGDPKRGWLSETGDFGPESPLMGSRHAGIIRDLATNYPEIGRVSFYDRPDMWPMWFDRAADGTYTPNANGLAVRDVIREINGPVVAPVDPELERLRQMKRDHDAFDRIVLAALVEFDGDLRALLSDATDAGDLMTAENRANAVLARARNVKAALAAKGRAVRH